MALSDKLVQGEEILIRARKTVFIFIDSVLVFSIAAIFAFALFVSGWRWFNEQDIWLRLLIAFLPMMLAGVLVLRDIITFYSLELIVTNMRMIGRTGIVGQSHLDVRLNQVTNLRVDQSGFGRMMDYGKITFMTPGGEFKFKQVHDPRAVQRVANEVIMQPQIQQAMNPQQAFGQNQQPLRGGQGGVRR